MPRYIAGICALLVFAAVAACAADTRQQVRWKVESYRQESGADDKARSVIYVSVRDVVGNSSFVLRSETYATKIKEVTTVGQRLIVIGQNDRFDTAIIFALPEHSKIDDIVGYGIALLNERWLAYVEYYPNHVFDAFPTDVVLLYDLSLTPDQNRAYDPQLIRDPWMAAQRSGLPVFPENNHERLSYENIEPVENATDLVIRNTFCLVGDRWLVFAASTDGGYSEQRRYLVEIDISKGPRQAVILKKEFPREVLETLQPGRNIEVTAITPAGPHGARVVLGGGERPSTVLVPVP